jgi:hypothetical protein
MVRPSVMRPYPTLASGRAPEAALMGIGGLLVIGAVVLGVDGPVPYLILAAVPAVALAWWRPAAGFALLLGLVLLTEQYSEILAEGIQPFLLDTLPLFENLEDYTPLSFMYANLLEVWLLLLVGIWFVRAIARGETAWRPVVCPLAGLLAAATVTVAFVVGVQQGGDIKIALWEVRAFGYLFGLGWFVPQLVERRRDVRLLLTVLATALGVKALEGLYRYLVELRMQLDLEDTFLAHEEPVMFIPLFFLLVTLAHARTEPRLVRLLAFATPGMLVALVLTQRRVAYVSLLLCGVVGAVILAPAARRTYLRVAGPVALVGSLYVLLFYGSASPLARPIDRALQLFDTDNRSNHYRVVELENLRYTIDLHPWGVGFGQPFEMLHDLPKSWIFYDYIPHNEILWLWVKTGTVGFVLLMYYFARVVAEAVSAHHRLRDPLARAVAAVVALAIINQLVVAYYDLQLTYARSMVYLGTVVGLLGSVMRWDGARDARAGAERP